MRVLLVDDHPLYREGMGMVLTTMTDVEVVGQAGDGESSVSLAVDSGRTWS